jgi:hypothetical protein
MRKIVLFILLTGFLLTGFAQEASYADRVSKENANYVAKGMNLKKDKTKYLESVLLVKYKSVSEELKAAKSDISREDRKAIYQKSYDKLMSDLSKEFSQEEIISINKLLKEQNEKRKKA